MSSLSSQQDRKGDSNKMPKAKKAKGQQNQGEKMREKQIQNQIKKMKKELEKERKRREAAEKETKDKDKLLKDKDMLLHDKDKLLQDERKMRKEERKRRKSVEKESKDKDKLLQGTYYATFDEVWGPHPVSFGQSDYDAMIRDNFPCYRSDSEKMDSRFAETMVEAKDVQNTAAFDSARVSVQICPVDVLKSKFHDRNKNSKTFLKIQGASHDTSIASRPIKSRASSAQVAHLVPHSSQNASLYYHVAIWVFGQETRGCEPSVVQKLIHGSVKPRAPEPVSVEDPPPAKGSEQNPMPTEASVHRPMTTKGSAWPREHEMGSVQGSASSRGLRVSCTGLKHMICNKIQLFGQAEHFDRLPCVIIVPVLSLKQAKEWKGEGYDAIFMISTGSKEEGSGRDLQQVAAGVCMLDVDEVANETEISSARDLLTATIKGLAFALREKSSATENWVQKLSDNAKEVLDCMRGNSAAVTGEKKIMVPERRDKAKDVRRITFAPAFGPVGNNGHPAPDPILLTVKAALNWSMFHEQPLMPAGECNDSDSQTSEFSLAAMEEYLAMREQYELVSRDEEIMNMNMRKKINLQYNLVAIGISILNIGSFTYK